MEMKFCQLGEFWKWEPNVSNVFIFDPASEIRRWPYYYFILPFEGGIGKYVMDFIDSPYHAFRIYH